MEKEKTSIQQKIEESESRALALLEDIKNFE